MSTFGPRPRHLHHESDADPAAERCPVREELLDVAADLDPDLYPSEDFKPYRNPTALVRPDRVRVVATVGRFELFLQGLVLGYSAGRTLLLLADLVRAVRARKR